MRQVNQDELVHIIVSGLRDIGPTLLKQLADGRHLVQSDARHHAAKIIAGKLARWEILSTAPEPPVFKRCGGAAPVHEGEG